MTRRCWKLARKALTGAVQYGSNLIANWRTKVSFMTLRAPQYLGLLRGRTVVILCTGPSMDTCVDDVAALIERTNAVVFGVNDATRYLPVDYHCFTNQKRFKSFYDYVLENSVVLLGPSIPRRKAKKLFNDRIMWLSYRNDRPDDFSIKQGVVQTDCRSSGVLLVAIAYLMGAKHIYVCGLDGYGSAASEHDRLVDQDNYKYLHLIDEYLAGAQPKCSFKIVTPTVFEKFYMSICKAGR